MRSIEDIGLNRRTIDSMLELIIARDDLDFFADVELRTTLGVGVGV